MSQMKEQDKTPEKQLNEVEIGKLPKKEFKVMIIKMLTEPKNEWTQNFNRQLENIKMNQKAVEYSKWNLKYTRRNQ